MQRRARNGAGAAVWQPLQTIKCVKNLPDDKIEIIQPASQWRRTEQLSGLLVRSNIYRVDADCHVYLDTAATINGPWHTAVDLTSAGVAETTLSSASTTDVLSGYLRWRVAHTGTSGTAWTVSFKLTVYPSLGHEVKLQLNPRVA
jgi:hypothetical protein